MAITKDDLNIAIAFAKLELIELEAGTRRLQDCPGLLKIGNEIRYLTRERRSPTEAFDGGRLG